MIITFARQKKKSASTIGSQIVIKFQLQGASKSCHKQV